MMPPMTLTASWRARVFAATWLSYAGLYFCRKPFYVTKSDLKSELGFDATTLGNIGAAYLVAYAAGQFLAGTLGNIVGPRIVVLVGMSISILLNVGFGLSSTVSAFFFLMTLNGVAQATGWSSNVGTMANWFRKGERGRVMGFWSTNFTVGALVSTSFAAWVLGNWGFRSAYFAGAAVLVVVVVLYWFNQRTRPEDVGLPAVEEAAATHGDRHPAHLDRRALVNVLMVGTFYFFAKFIRYALWSWVPFFLKENFGLQGDDAGYVSTVFDFAGIAGVVGCGWLSDKVFSGRRAPASLVFLAAMTAACGLLFLFGTKDLTIFVLCLALIGVSLVGPDGLLTGAGAIDVGSPRTAVLATGLISGIGSMGPVVQELLIGKMYDSGGGDLGPILLMLFGSAVAATLPVIWLTWARRV